MKTSVRIFFCAALVCFFSTFTHAQALDDSRVFDASYYLNSYPDLQKAFNGNLAQARQHWFDYGIREGRQASSTFNAPYYLGLYPDLQQAFGATNYAEAIKHWQNHGIAEARKGVKASERVNGREVRYVQFTNDNGNACGFRQETAGKWSELMDGRIVFNFNEVNRDDWSVYLQDPSRGIALQLDLHLGKVMISSIDGSNRRFLYNILWSIRQ